MNNAAIILTCKSVIFYALKDEDAFFEWIKKIDCVTQFASCGDELYLHIVAKEIPDQDLDELLALFYRYKIDMKQLQIFLNEKNKEWFYDNKKSFFYWRVFGV